MKNNSIKTYISVFVIITGFIAIFALSNFLETNNPQLPEGYQDSDLSLQGEKLKGFVFGADGLVADWYWMQSLQYLGTKIQESDDKQIDIGDLRKLKPKLLYPYLDNATTLDPHFMTAYSYGAVVLPSIDGDLAIKIIEKGIKNNPDNWRLYQHLGFIYWKSEDYEKAAEAYEKGSKIKDAPAFFKSMVAKMKNKGGSRETAREIYQQMFDEAADTKTKESAKLRLYELDSQDEQEAVNKVLQNFKETNTSCVRNWQELFQLLKDIRLPNNKDFRINQLGNLVDPSDIPYLLDKEKCEIKLDADKTKIPLS